MWLLFPSCSLRWRAFGWLLMLTHGSALPSQVALTIGTIVLGVWIFSQLQSNNRWVACPDCAIGDDCASCVGVIGLCLLLGNRGGGRRDQPGLPRQRGRRQQPLPQPQRRTLLPGGFDIGGNSDSELADVWFERDDRQREQRGRRRI